MRQFSCSLTFEFQRGIENLLIDKAMNVLGFHPERMYIYVDQDKVLDEIPFDESLMRSMLKKHPTKIQIMNKLYDESSDYFWLRIGIDEICGILKLEWHNSNLDFLIDDNKVGDFLQIEGFICGYCYDNEDRYNQSFESVEYFQLKNPGFAYTTKKNKREEDIIDTSRHWGRLESACGMDFIAAPLMWFGEIFFKTIDKDRLLKFKYSNLGDNLSKEIVLIRLFELYDIPGKPENRNKQEEFWRFFDLGNIIENYRKTHEIDEGDFFKNYILKMNAGKKKG